MLKLASITEGTFSWRKFRMIHSARAELDLITRRSEITSGILALVLLSSLALSPTFSLSIVSLTIFVVSSLCSVIVDGGGPGITIQQLRRK
jgi:hypothetical protein